MIFERRLEPRRRTRLRPAKLLTEGGGFLCDCALVERSETGARVRAFRPPERTLPEDLMLYDEIEGVKLRARVVWAEGAELGLAILSTAAKVEAEERHRIAGRFYAVGN